MSAWCLGVLNSHRRFLLSYTAPVLWNLAMIVTLLWFGPGTPLPRLAVLLAWGALAGSALQLGVQVPFVLRAAPGLLGRATRDGTAWEHVRGIGGTFVPVFVSRGVVQISAYIDTVLASLLPTGAVTGLANAQLLYTLPVSLFGLSVSAAELPAMAGEIGPDSSGAEAVRRRMDAALRRIAFFVVPSAMAFLALGDVIAGALFQTGRFTAADSAYVWAILAGSAAGLLPSTLGRLYASAYYALRDTRTPLNYAIVHVAIATVCGYLFAVPLPPRLGIPPAWGAAGLTFAAALAGWVEMLMLRRSLKDRIGETGLPMAFVAKLWGASAAAAVTGWAVRLAAPPAGPVVAAVLILVPYGLVFGGLTLAMGIPEARAAMARVRQRR
jgi:putative peptidoglycan lipid II flippase